MDISLAVKRRVKPPVLYSAAADKSTLVAPFEAISMSLLRLVRIDIFSADIMAGKIKFKNIVNAIYIDIGGLLGFSLLLDWCGCCMG